MVRSWTAAAAALLVAIAGVFSAGSARGEGKLTLNGTWSASPLSESWSVSDWGEACGPKPTGHGAGGGSVKVQEQGGELSISGAGRAFSTAECWEQMPGLARTSHSASGGGRSWTTRCSSPANDPRHAAVVTRIQATDTSMSLNETGQYQFLIHDTNCTATATRSRSYSLVKREGEEASAASATASAAPVATAPPKPAPEPKPSAKCVAGSAGEPARLEVHPAKKLLRAGDRFVFRAAVLDSEGCSTGARPTWSIAPGPIAGKATIDAAGTLVVEAGAAEGKLDVVASILGKSVTVPVEVTSAEHYDALLAAGRDGAGDDTDAAVAVIATGTIGGRTVVSDDKARERKTTFLAIAVGLSLALGFVGLVLARRGRRTEAAEDGVADAPVEAGGADEDPVFGADGAGDGPPVAETPPAIPTAVTPPIPVKSAAKRAASKGKICPTCGELYPAEAVFCGKDATSLVLVN